MSMDGIALGAVIHELQPLIGGKIDKVQQPEKDLLLFVVRANNANLRLLVSTHTMNRFAAITDETLKTVGPILFVTAAGGVLGKVITAAGFVEFMKANAAFLSSVGIFFPFLISAILKTAQGSSTVAITTTAGIMGMYTDSASMMSALGLQSEMAALLTVMAIGAGAMTVSHANDSYFWVVTNFTGLDPQDGYRTQSMMTLVVGIVSMVSIFLASLVLL